MTSVIDSRVVCLFAKIVFYIYKENFPTFKILSVCRKQIHVIDVISSIQTGALIFHFTMF